MKKLFFLIVAIISVFNASAQEIDLQQDQSAAISIDSLSIRLNKLQHDYNFMSCDYELYKLIMDLKDLSHSLDNASNGVIINIFNNRFERELYNSYLANYDSSCAVFEILKEKIEAVRVLIMVKIASSDFNDKELNVLKTSFDVINSAVTKVETSLNYFNACIKAYRSKR